MRITDSMLYRSGVLDLLSQRERLARIQEQASSGLAINRPSDDPVGVRAAALLRDSLALTEQYQRNVTRGRARISAVESALSHTTELLMSAREMAIQGASSTTGPEARANLAAEMERLHEALLSSANRKSGGAHIFSGYTSNTEPFQLAGNFQEGVVPGPDVSFVGDVNEIQIDIDDGVRLPVTLNGQRVFMGDGDGDGSPDAARVDLFVVLRDLRDALVVGDDASIGQAIDDIDTAINQLSRERTRIGASDTQADLWQDRLRLQETELTAQLSLVEDADSIEVFSELVKQETALQASLEATSRLLQPSLLDFL